MTLSVGQTTGKHFKWCLKWQSVTHVCNRLSNPFLLFREEWMRAIQSVANNLKMREQDDEEPMDVFGSPSESSLEEMEVAMSKSRTKVVRGLDITDRKPLFYLGMAMRHSDIFAVFRLSLQGQLKHLQQFLKRNNTTSSLHCLTLNIHNALYGIYSYM